MMRAHHFAPLALVPLALVLALSSTSPAGARREHIAATRQCIPIHSIRDETAESDSRLIFHVSGGGAFRNHLPEPCEDLLRINNVDKLKLSAVGDVELCEGDNVQVIHHDGSLLGAIGAGGPTREVSCKLGQFEPISEMSLTEELRR
ncbi:hypothetical protein [Sphingomonas sp. PR090111-T3T-6A]|uniref:hypothetical protein n=1 Tax=Sphingomonas sp. PR090111-T3T-6A TaxID=685778 RepID=UPI00039BEF44|nr:hypothetical protein [Sphingomonas sp. PR090111-T3T-6A]